MAINVRKKLVVDPATGNGKPTATHYEEVAAQTTSLVNQVAALIPYLEAPHPGTTPFVRGQQNVPIEFIATVTSSVDANEELQGLQFDPVAAKDMLQYDGAFQPLLRHILGLARDLKFSLDSRKASVAADALQMYVIAKGISRATDSPKVVEHVLNMQNALGRLRPKARLTKAEKADKLAKVAAVEAAKEAAKLKAKGIYTGNPPEAEPAPAPSPTPQPITPQQPTMKVVETQQQ
ncbi:MAG: hypothetical protein JWO56_1264 [Acidobacteria bacterium]|nr:hypothetical protein [Acidobacteriota bacterium]